MTANTTPASPSRGNLTTAVLLILPLIVLGGVIWLFLSTGGGLNLTAPAPVEALTVERTLLKPGTIELSVRNSGPQALQIAQVIVNDAVWPFTISANPIPRLGTATLHLDYHWSQGEAYAVRMFSSNALPFDAVIPVAFETPTPNADSFLAFTLIGIYVGVIPVYLGLVWFPALRKLGRKAMIFLMALTAGVLVFLGLDTLAEALSQAAAVPGPFQGIGLIGIGVVGTFLLLEVISRRKVASAGAATPRSA